MDAVGSVLSSFTRALDCRALFAAASVHVPPFDTEVPAKGVFAVTDPLVRVLLNTPDWTGPVSAHEKLTVTSELFQPAAFGRGEIADVTTGAVLSIFTRTVPCAAELPALSTHDPLLETLEPVVSPTTGTGVTIEFVAKPEDGAASEQENPTLTSVEFQPCAVGGGLTLPAIEGATESTLTVRVVGPPTLLARSIAVQLRVLVPSKLMLAVVAPADTLSSGFPFNVQVMFVTNPPAGRSVVLTPIGAGFVLNHPLVPSGEELKEIVGGVESTMHLTGQLIVG